MTVLQAPDSIVDLLCTTGSTLRIQLWSDSMYCTLCGFGRAHTPPPLLTSLTALVQSLTLTTAHSAPFHVCFPINSFHSRFLSLPYPFRTFWLSDIALREIIFTRFHLNLILVLKNIYLMLNGNIFQSCMHGARSQKFLENCTETINKQLCFIPSNKLAALPLSLCARVCACNSLNRSLSVCPSTRNSTTRQHTNIVQAQLSHHCSPPLSQEFHPHFIPEDPAYTGKI